MSKKIPCPQCGLKVKDSVGAQMWHIIIHKSERGTKFPSIFGGKRK